MFLKMWIVTWLAEELLGFFFKEGLYCLNWFGQFVSFLDYVRSNYLMMINSELERIGKGAVVTQLKVVCLHRQEGLRRTMETPQNGQCPGCDRNLGLPNKIRQHCRFLLAFDQHGFVLKGFCSWKASN